MRHVRILGLCLVAVFALAAMTASGASAKTPKKDLLQFNEESGPAAPKAQGKQRPDRHLYRPVEWGTHRQRRC